MQHLDLDDPARYALDFGHYEAPATDEEASNRDDAHVACVRGTPRRHTVDKDGGVMGRSRACTVRVRGAHVSRRHASISTR